MNYNKLSITASLSSVVVNSILFLYFAIQHNLLGISVMALFIFTGIYVAFSDIEKYITNTYIKPVAKSPWE